MPDWDGRTKGGMLGYKIFLFILRYSNINLAYIVLRFVAAYFLIFVRPSSLLIQKYFQIIHKKSFWESYRLTYKNFYVFGQTLLDKFVLMANIKNNFTFDFDGEENLHQMVREGKGGILISGHIGNWDIAGHLLYRINTKVNVVIYDNEVQKIKQLTDSFVDKPNVNFIGIKDDMSHMYAIAQAIANNELICIHGDRFLEGQPIKEVDFMGGKAKFPVGPFQLAAKLNVPYTLVFALKETKTHYQLSSTKLINAGGKDSDKVFEHYLEVFEKKVRKYPVQWFNYFPFWDKQV